MTMLNWTETWGISNVQQHAERAACGCTFPAAALQHRASRVCRICPAADRVFGSSCCGVMGEMDRILRCDPSLRQTGVAVPLANHRGSASAALVNGHWTGWKARSCNSSSLPWASRKGLKGLLPIHSVVVADCKSAPGQGRRGFLEMPFCSSRQSPAPST